MRAAVTELGVGQGDGPKCHHLFRYAAAFPRHDGATVLNAHELSAYLAHGALVGRDRRELRLVAAIVVRDGSDGADGSE